MKAKSYRFSTVSNIMFVGFLFSFIHLEISYLTDFTTGISALLMWYGCYILRKENEALRKSFVMTSCILVIFTFVEIIRATPWIGLSSISVVKPICMLVLLYQYGKGMQDLNLAYGGKSIIQCKSIYKEYLAYIGLMYFTIVVPTSLIYFGIILLVVILVQIYRIHSIVKEHVKNKEFTCCFVPVIPAAATYIVVIIAIIMTSSYLVHRNLTSDYEVWKISTGEKRDALVQKGLSKQVSKDLSDDAVEALSEVKAFRVYEENQNQDFPQTEEYVGVDQDGNLYHLMWINFDKVDFNGNCSIIPVWNTSRENGVMLDKEVAFLYDQGDTTYGRKESSQSFDINFAKGKHHRGYVYSIHDISDDQMMEFATNIIYQDSWFQYPYTYHSLAHSYQPVDDILTSMTQTKNYKTKFHTILIERKDFKME